MKDKKLPDTAETFSLLQAKQEAHDTVSGLIERNLELEEIFENLQPLLSALSVKLYADNNETILLNKLITDSVDWIEKGIIPVSFKEVH